MKALRKEHRHYGRLRRMLRGDSIECALISVEKMILDQLGTLFKGEGKVQFREDSVEINTRLLKRGACLG